MKRALVLGGGGARGAFQVGMLDVLVREQGLDFDVIRGVSVGALNAAFLAQAPVAGGSLANLQASVGDLLRLWMDRIEGNASIYSERTGGFAGLAAGADSLLDNEPLWKLMRESLDEDRIRTSGRDFAVGVASLVTGEYCERRPEEPSFLELVLASTAIPVVFPPVWREVGAEKDVLVDGGAREITPLSAAFKSKPDEIWVLMTSRAMRRPDGGFPSNTTMPRKYADWDDGFLGTGVNGVTVLRRAVDILSDEVYLDDIRGAVEWNGILERARDVIAAAEQPGVHPNVAAAAAALKVEIGRTKKRPVRLRVLAPQDWYGDENSGTAFSPKLIRKAIRHGREVARDPSRWLLS